VYKCLLNRSISTLIEFGELLISLVVFFFSIDLILPSRTMALGSTQPQTEMSTRNLRGGYRAPDV
jgi:hypothetical protein